MLAQPVTYPPRNGYPLHITAKRYWAPEFEANTDGNALTLIVLHSTSFHKETWEPSLEQLFKLASGPGSRVRIREAWALDCPNHGEAGELNERLLAQQGSSFTCTKYAQSVHHFLSAGPHHGARVDFRERKLVGIGHSLGSNAILLLQHLEPVFLFSSIVIVEPMLSPEGPQHLAALRSALVKGAYERRDVWADRSQAMAALKRRDRTRRWDPRVLDLYVKYAIRLHPVYNGVTLSCTRDQEAAMYRDEDGPTKPVEDLNKACVTRPVHLVLGVKHDLIPPRVHDALTDPNSGRRYASVTRIEESGHLIPQEIPEKLGTVLYETLNADVKCQPKSKL